MRAGYGGSRKEGYAVTVCYARGNPGPCGTGVTAARASRYGVLGGAGDPLTSGVLRGVDTRPRHSMTRVTDSPVHLILVCASRSFFHQRGRAMNFMHKLASRLARLKQVTGWAAALTVAFVFGCEKPIAV